MFVGTVCLISRSWPTLSRMTPGSFILPNEMSTMIRKMFPWSELLIARSCHWFPGKKYGRFERPSVHRLKDGKIADCITNVNFTIIIIHSINVKNYIYYVIWHACFSRWPADWRWTQAYILLGSRRHDREVRHSNLANILPIAGDTSLVTFISEVKNFRNNFWGNFWNLGHFF